jgi:hypothetical protein
MHIYIYVHRMHCICVYSEKMIHYWDWHAGSLALDEQETSDQRE